MDKAKHKRSAKLLVLEDQEDDNLPILPIGPWAEDKLRVLSNYCNMFTSSMAGKWGGVNYIDLFAGPGLGRIEGTNRIVKGSPLLALSTKVSFDSLVFCEKLPEFSDALSIRCQRIKPDANAQVLRGDCNVLISDVISAASQLRAGSKALTFCFVDPFSLRLEFETIRSLVGRIGKIDFLFLLALDMDGRRNERVYVDAVSPIVDSLLADKGWRDKWESAKRLGTRFQSFVASSFAEQMFELGYYMPPEWVMMEFKDQARNVPLYHLAFFSKNPLGYKFWNECRKYGRGQQSLGL